MFGVVMAGQATESLGAVNPTQRQGCPGDPNCFVIGGIRCATTWLHSVLSEFPEVAVSHVEKETHFFNDRFDRGEAWYRSLFPQHTAARWIVDATPSYLDSPEVAERIKAFRPDARLICIVRDPVERAYSDFCRRLNHGEIGSDIEAELTPDSPIVQHGMYFRNLQPFLRSFSRDQLLVLVYDDLLAEPRAFFEQVRSFLALPDSITPAKLTLRLNETKPLKRWPLLHEMLRGAYHAALRLPMLGRIAFRLRSGKYLSFYHRWNRSKLRDYPVLPLGLRQRLRHQYREDVAALGAWMGRDLSHWVRPSSQSSGS